MVSPVTILACLLIIIMSAHGGPDPTLDKHWKLWVLQNQKGYMNAIEDLERRMIWEDTLKFVTIHNLEYSLGLHTYEVGMNHLADMTSEEVVATMTGIRAPAITDLNSTGEFVKQNVKVPNSIDWRSKDCVTGVKNQGGCGSCWSFSATGALECQMKLKTGRLQSLSEQELVDCSGSYGNQGCNGGWMRWAFKYVIDHGLALESSYPYQGKEGTCHSAPRYATCQSYKMLPSGNELALQQAVGTVGPVSVAIDASQRSFQVYNRGVYYDPNCNPQKPDHAVLAAGYGTENGVDYWLVKNSWSTAWGDGGYIKMARNRYNHCGIAGYGVYPIV
ncbi:cathepsin S-like [Rana temporaria]|uniref:cathepsin S-like n=1 Tax=Rana temporaria TaxID=8407 RepID=UPI001AACDB12|nr:cathepsin S-like [Rana temporaria]